MENKFKCPACGGDGQETCNNPDHGFLISVIGAIKSANESACPCCGHDEDHKIFKYVEGKRVKVTCYECSGKGVVNESDCERILDEWSIDQPTEDFKL